MLFTFDDRPSDSSFVERIWRARSEHAGTFLSVASSHWEMVVTRLRGNTMLTLRGPETQATSIDCPADGEWIGVRFKLGTFMPHQPVGTLIDRRDVNLPDRSGRWFVLEGSSWEYPSYENAEVFVRRLVHARLVVRDPAVEAALEGDTHTLSRRSAQRHFVFATGMTQTTHRKIEQARYAVSLLRRGVTIADAIHDAGYYDQAHLTRSLRHLIGETPARVLRQERQLSFLYKTPPPGRR